MGYGDYIMMSGDFKALRLMYPNVRIRFPEHLKDHPLLLEVFRNNPHYKTHMTEEKGWTGSIPLPSPSMFMSRVVNDRITWSDDYTSKPGELFLSTEEKLAVSGYFRGLNKPAIFLQPFTRDETIIKAVPRNYGASKRWPLERYEEIIKKMDDVQFIVAQEEGKPEVKGALNIKSKSFRYACAILDRCQLYLGNEGGMHHAAAALNVPGVVIFGSWISPKVTGYALHDNLFIGSYKTNNNVCGSVQPCNLCERNLKKIQVEDAIYRLRFMLDNCPN